MGGHVVTALTVKAILPHREFETWNNPASPFTTNSLELILYTTSFKGDAGLTIELYDESTQGLLTYRTNVSVTGVSVAT